MQAAFSAEKNRAHCDLNKLSRSYQNDSI